MAEVVVALLWKSSRLNHSPKIDSSFGSPAEIGRLFLTDHLLAFEITSIVLLVAAVGGVVLGIQAREPDGELMIGPNVPWYLAISGMLFGIGAVGVMLRRSPLIVLLSLEIMLNAGNLALVGSLATGALRRPGVRNRRDGGRRVRGLRRSRPDRRDGTQAPRARRRPALGAPRMTATAVGGWVCLLAPLAGALLITLAGTSISRRTAAYLGTLSVFVAFVGALVSFFSMWSRQRRPIGASSRLHSPGFRAAPSTSACPSSSTRSRS